MYTAPDRSRKYTIDMLDPILKGDMPLPNVELITADQLMNGLLASGTMGNCLKGYFSLPQDTRMSWGAVWPWTLQDGQFSGVFYFAIYNYKATICGTAAFCRHENQYMPSAVPMRGFHDQFCVKCGLDTSYDSSD